MFLLKDIVDIALDVNVAADIDVGAVTDLLNEILDTLTGAVGDLGSVTGVPLTVDGAPISIGDLAGTINGIITVRFYILFVFYDLTLLVLIVSR